MHKQTWGLRRKRPLVLKIPGHADVTITRTPDDKIEVRVPDEIEVRRIDSEDDSLGGGSETDIDCE